MTAKDFARNERLLLAEAFVRVGPDAPTLCEGWSARHLATHLVLRERRPDAALGMFAPFLAKYTEAISRGMNRLSWERLIEQFKTGPGVAIAPLDSVINVFELFVHHEDLLRADQDWTVPRKLDVADEELLWRRLRASSKVFWRRAQVGVVLESPFGKLIAHRPVNGETVTLRGEVTELVMASFGRTKNQAEIIGTENAIALFHGINLSV